MSGAKSFTAFSGLSIRRDSFSRNASLCVPRRALSGRLLTPTQKPVSRICMSAVLPVVTFDGSEAGSIELDVKGARPETAKAVVHRAVVAYLQNGRRGTASTLTRSEVRGGGRKPFKQKGSGRARQGSSRTPLKPGGGVAFGPKPKDWSIKINKKEKRLAVSTAIQSAVDNSSALVVEDFPDQFEKPRTKEFVEAMKRWGIDTEKEHVMFFTADVSQNLVLSCRNIQKLQLVTPANLNVYDVVRADRVVVTKSGISYLNRMYGAAFEVEGEGEEGGEEGVFVLAAGGLSSEGVSLEGVSLIGAAASAADVVAIADADVAADVATDIVEAKEEVAAVEGGEAVGEEGEGNTVEQGESSEESSEE